MNRDRVVQGLVEHGLSKDSSIVRGVRPSVLRILPGMWSSGYRLLVVSDPNVYIFSATANYASVDRLIEVASLSEIDVTFRAWERQMLVRLPGGASIVIDGKREVLSARQILGR